MNEKKIEEKQILEKIYNNKNENLYKVIDSVSEKPDFILKDLISDSSINDPLKKLAEEQEYDELLSKIKNALSDSEYEVFKLYSNGFDYQTIALITDKNSKQIDNTIQRLKHKIRDIIRSN